MDKIKILIVDDNFVARRGLRSFLNAEEGITVEGEASTGLEAIEFIKHISVDIILMDIRMPNIDGIETTSEIIKIRPEIKVLILSVIDEQLVLIKAILAGASGYLVYGKFTPEYLLETICNVASGKNMIISLVSPEILNQAQNSITETQNIDKIINIEPLTERERDILSLIAIGKRNREIASTLNIKEKTVKNNINNIYSKLHIRSRYEAISYILNISHAKV
jgi:DNA-binding NarL/FixJ family response regulator